MRKKSRLSDFIGILFHEKDGSTLKQGLSDNDECMTWFFIKAFNMFKRNGQLEILFCRKEAMLGPYSSLLFLVCPITPILVSLKITLI